MFDAEPIRVFNVCDEDGNTYEVKVFEGVVNINLNGTTHSSKLEFMLLDHEHLLIENGTDIFMAGIEKEFKQFRSC